MSKMLNKNKLGKTIFGLLFSLSIIAGCGNEPTNFPIDQGIINSSAILKNGDISVKFNTAYKALYTDNEKIGRASPDNPDKLFIKVINGAQKTLDLAVFDIDDPDACKALIAAHERGVRVRIVTDTDNLNDKNFPNKPRQVLEDMRAAGIPIKDDKRNAFMHNKFVVMDGAVVLTGSMNLTTNALYRDNNNSLKIDSTELAADYTAEFNRLFVQGMFGTNPHDIPFKQVNVEGANMNVYFSPKGGIKDAIIQALKNARTNIKFMAFSLTDADIQNVIVQKFKEGIKVEGIFDGCMISKFSLFSNLKAKSIPVYIDGNQALLHDKVFIIDNNKVITGSYNFSSNAEDSNDENVLIIQSENIAGYYNTEYGRLKNASLKNKVPPYDNRTCSSNMVNPDDDK